MVRVSKSTKKLVEKQKKIAAAKVGAEQQLYYRLETTEEVKKVFHLARRRHRARKNVSQVK